MRSARTCPIGTAVKADAHRRYARLRAQGPIHRAQFSPGVTGWVVVHYELAREALTHPALLRNPPTATMPEAAESLGHERGTGSGGRLR